MKFKRNFLTIFSISLVALTSSCTFVKVDEDTSTTPGTETQVVMPKGAPTLSAYELINHKEVTVMDNASNIPTFFSSASYPFIVFDSVKGLNLIEKAGENAHYEFDMMLTGGNFHLFAFNKNESELENLTITDEDYILGFQKSGTPDLLFRTIYSGVTECDTYLNDISSLKDKLLGMSEDYRVDRNVVDYAIVAEPAATAIKTQLTKKGLKVADINLQKEYRNKFSNEWDKDFIPQAGLFVRKDIKTKYPDYYSQIKASFYSSITNVLTDPKNVKTSIESVFPDVQDQNSNYGFASNMITLVQGEDGKKNGFGIVPKDVNFTINDIKLFNSSLIKK